MRNSDDNAPQDQNLIGASVTDLTAEDINTSENSPYTATATAVDRVDSQTESQGDSQTESRADKDGSDVLDTPDISFLLKDYDNHFDGLGDLSFSQEGSDLRVVDGDGNEYIIAGYFDEAPPPSLRISESTELPFDFVQTLLAGTDLPAASGETPRATMVDAHDYAEYGSSIGNVETIVGEVKIIRTDGQTQILEAGDPVFEGDQILTETGASVKLVFLDNTLFSLGEDAQMTLDKMLYNAEEESGEVVLSMLKGMFLFVSGKIAKTDPTDMVVNTPVATIGIRGTIVTGRIDPDAQQTFEITVIDGAIATIPSGSDEPIVMSESFSTIIGENNAAGNLEISQSQETPQAVVARNVQQFSVLSSEDLQGIELAVESSAAESGEDVDLDLESALEIAVENETLGDVDAEQEDAVVDTPIPDAPAASNGAEEVEFESDVLLEDERPLEETLELEEEEESKGLEPAPELDITPPDPPLFVLAVNENNYLESGNSIIEGETEAGALVSVTLAGSLTNPDGTVSQSEAVFETLADDAGNWAIDFENDDPVSGNYNFAEESEVQLSVTAADASGNVSDAETGSFNFDLTAPEAPVIAPDSSVSYTASDNTTYIDGKTLSGTAEAGTTVHVTVDSETVDVTADEDGNWTLDLGANGIKPDHGDNITVSAQSEDKAGNLGETATQTYVVDSQTTAPQIAFNDLKNEATDNSPALSGTAEPGATVEVIVDDGKNSETFSVDADSNGNWTLDLGQESDGTLSLTHDVTLTAKATATDLVGNTSGTSSTSVKVDNSTTLSDVKFDKVVDGAADGDPPLVDGTPLLSGTAEPGSEVVVTVTDGDDNQTTFTPTVDASGNWSVMIVSKDDFEIKDGGSFSVKVDSKDLHENTATVSLGPYDVDASTVDPTISFDTAVTGEVGAEPVLTGTAEPGSTVTVTVDDGTNSEVIEVDADESGNWTLTLDGTNSGNVDLTHGSTLTASATSKDALGNESLNSASTTEHTVDASTVDPTIAFDTAVTGEVGAEPVLTGTAEPDSKVYVTVDDGTNSEVIEVDAGGSGNWSLTLDGTNSGNVDLTHGSTLTASATSTDVHGNESVNSASTTEHTVDASTADPTIAFDTAVTGEVGATPVLTGTAEPGSKVYVTVDDGTNSEVIEVDAGGSGNWSLTLDGTNSGNVDLTHGSTLTASATSTDVHENESVNSASTTEHTVDASTYLSNVAFDNVVNNEVGAKPVLKGIAEPGSTVTVVVTDKNGNEATYTPAVDDETGAWSVEVTGDPQGTGFAVTDDGTLSAVVDSKDELGNEATQVSLGPYGVDATVSDSDAAFADAIGDTVGAEPVLSGTAEPDSMVKVTVTDGSGKDAVFTTKVGSSGTWSVTVTGDPQQTGFAVTDGGTLVASARFEDPLGNTATVALDPYKVDASTTDPVFEFTTGTDDTSDKTPELVGTAEADSIVSVKVTDSLTPANSETFTVTADSNGDWSLSIDSNNAGSLSLGHDVTLTAEATSTDIHNNESNSSKAEVTIDAEAEVGTFAFEGASGTTVGKEPVLSGQAVEPNSKVIVIIEDTDTTDKGTFSTTADADGNWSITVKSGGDSGNDALVVDHDTPLSVSVTVFDEHNNSKTEKSADTYTVDASTTLENVGFEDPSSGLTDGTPVLSGEAEPGSSISVVVKDGNNVETTFTTTADAQTGVWSVTVVEQDGLKITHGDTLSATVTSTDSVGNSTSETVSATVDNVIGTLTAGFEDPASGLTDGTPVLSGEAEPGSSISVVVKDGNGGETTFTTTADATTGVWSVDVIAQDTLTINDTDTLTATVTSTDSVGNSTSETVSATVDNVIGTLTAGFEDPASGLTDGTPVLSGEAEPGSSISVVVKDGNGGETTFTTTADATTGVWSVDVIAQDTLTINDTDTLTATVTSTDSVGNSTSETVSAVVDNTIGTLTAGFEDPSSGLTDGTPVLSGKAEPGSSISVVVKDGNGGETTFTTTADATTGVWSVDVIAQDTLTINDTDTLTATVTSTDSVGNSTSETVSAVVDNTIGTLTAGFESLTSGLTDGTPVLSGKAEPGSSISVVVKDGNGGETTFTTTADATTGVWSVDVIAQDTLTINDTDTLTATVTSTDSVGNSTSETVSAVVDNTIGTLTAGFESLTSGLTDGTPVLSGKAEPGSSISVVVKDGNGGETTFTTTADATTGVWSVDVIAQDTLTINDTDTLTATVTSTDSVGNSTSETVSAVVDNTIGTLTAGFESLTSGLTDGTPVLSGKAEPGSSISVVVKDGNGGETTFTTTADATTGVWSVDVIAQDTLTINDTDTLTATVTSTDSVGNSTSETVSAVVDNTIGTLTAGFESLTSGLTDGTPVLSGKAEPGSSISVVVKDGNGGETTFTTTADATTGVWSVDVIAQDTLTINDTDTLTATVTSTDSVGNSTSETVSAVVDNTIGTLTAGFESLTSGLTDGTPVLSGKAEPGSSISVVVKDGNGGETTFTTTADATTGVWSVDVIAQDTLTINDTDTLTATVTSTDSVGNSTSETVSAVVDNTIGTLTAGFESLTSGLTDGTPVLSGKAEPGSSISVVVKDGNGGETTFTTTADATTGVWSVDVIAQDTLTINDTDTLTATVTSTDSVGNSTSETVSAVVDNTIGTLTAGFESLTSGLTDGTPVLSGKAEPGSSISVVVKDGNGGETTFTTTADATTGVWSVDVIAQDTLTINDTDTLTATVTSTDSVGNSTSETVSAVVDNTIGTLTAGFESLTSGLTDGTPVLSGKAEPGSSISVVVKDGNGGETTFTTTADATTGVWSVDVIAQDTLTINDTDTLTATVTSTDSVGNSTSETVSAVVDNTIGTLTAGFESLTSGLTDGTPVLSGKAEPGSSISVVVKDGNGGETTFTTTADATTGVWSVDVIAQDTLTINDTDTLTATVTSTDSVGNSTSETVSAVVDNTIGTLTAGFESLTSGLTDGTPVLSGKAEPGSSISVVVKDGNGGETTFTTTADATTGVWSVDVIAQDTLTINDTDTLTATVTSTDSVGNSTSETVSAVVDNVIGTLTAGFESLTSGLTDGTPVLSGKAEPGSSISVVVKDGNGGETTFTTTADATTGVWSVDVIAQDTLTINDTDTLTATVTSTDSVGNSTSETVSAVVDNTIGTLTAGFESLTSGLTDGTPVLSGKAEPGSSISVVVKDGNGGETTFTTTADATTGVWSVDVIAQDTLTINDTDTLTATVTSTDSVGNSTSETVSAVVDNTIGTLTAGFESLTSGLTDGTPVLSGKAEPGSSISVVVKDGNGGETTFTTTADATTGVWSVDVIAQDTLTINDTDTLTATVTSTDSVGNSTSETVSAVVDNTIGTLTAGFEDPSSGLTDGTPVLSGKAEPGSSISVVVKDGNGGETTFTTTADATTGVWSVDVIAQDTLTINDTDTLTATVTSTDSVGNSTSETVSAVVDNTIGTLTAGFESLTSGLTDGTPVLSGKAEPGSSISVVVKDGNGGETTFTTTADATTGVWSVDVIAQDTLTINDTDTLTATVTSTDSVGNSTSETVSAVVDNTIGTLTAGFESLTSGLTDGTPVLSGKAEPGSSISVVVKDGNGGETTFTTTADATTGVWSVDVIAQDTLTINDTDTLTATVTSTDSVGNSTSETVSAVVDNTIGTLTAGFESLTSGLTDGTPVLSGKAEPGSSISVVVKDGNGGETTFTTTADATTGVWSVDVIAQDTLTINDTDTLTATVTSTDSVGNSTSETVSAVVDNTIGTLTAGFESLTSGLTDGTPVLSGKAEPGSSISVVVKDGNGGETTFTTTADATTGVWSVDVIAQDTLTINDTDTLTATVTSTDSVGNSTSETVSAVVDNTIGTLTAGFESLTSGLTDGTPVLSGKAEPGSSISVVVKDGNGGETTFTTTADATTGVWSVDVIAQDTLTINDTDTLTATVTSTDSVGNSTSETVSAVVDNTIGTLTAGFESLTSGLTDGTPVLSGKAEPGSSISVVVKDGNGGETTFTTTADATTGVWSVDVIAQDTLTINDTDTLTATVTSTDSVGNSTSETVSAVVDNTIGTLTAGFESLTSGLTDGTPVLSGKAEPGSSISVVVKDGNGGETTFTTTADATTGVWSVDVIAQDTLTINDTDTLTATVTSTDSVGNSTSETVSAVVDNVIGTLTAGFESLASGLTDGTPVLSGSAEPGSSISVVVKDGNGGETTFTTTADATTGVWSVDVIAQDTLTINDTDTLTATVTSTDSVGNSTSETVSAVVDNTIGTLTAGFESLTSGLTDGTPVLSGKAEPGSSISVVVKDGNGGETTFTTTADATTGVWSVDVIAQDTLTINDTDTLTATVTSTDSVGNSTSETVSAVVDNTIGTLTAGFESLTSGLTDGTPVLSGKAEPGSSISVVVKDGNGGETTFTTTADATTGVWSVDVIAQDTLTINDTDTLTATVTSTDSVGNSTSETVSAVVDNTIGTLTAGFEDPSSGLTDGTPVLSGSAEPGSSISVVVKDGNGGETTFTTTADATTGVWSVDVIAQDTLTINDTDTLTATVTSTDSVGNSTSETVSAVVDNTIGTLTAGFESLTSGLTDGTPVLSGKAEPGSSISVVVKDGNGGETTFTTTADATTGVWSVDVIAQDTLTINDTDTLTATVTSTDSVGNSTSETVSAVVDNTIGTLTAGFESLTSGLTDGTPVLSGKAEPGSSISVVVKDGNGGETTFTTTADATTGVWSVDVIAQDTLTINDTDTLTATVTSTDSVGNSTSETVSAVVDNTTDLTNVAFENTLTNTAGESFVGGEPVLSGVAEVGATVTVVVTDTTDSTKTATYTHVVTDSGGNWSIDIVDQGSFTVTHGGSFSVKVDSKDELLNDATTVNLGPYTVDAVAADPTVDILDQTPENIADLVAGTQPLFSGTADPNAAIKVEVTFPSGSTPASLTLDAQANGSGDWAISFNDLGSNKTAFTHGAAITLAVTATDPILNVSNTVTETYTVDYTTNETVDDTTFAGTTGDEVNFETQKADYLGPVSLTDSITSATTSKDEITTLTSFDDTVFVEDRGATYTNLGDGDDTIKFLKDEIAGVTGGTVFVDGGDGDDTADFSELTSSLYVQLTTTGEDVVNHTMSDGSTLYRSFTEVENISASSGWDTVEIKRGSDLPNIDGGEGIDRLVLSEGGTTNIIDLTGGTSTIDGNTVTMSGFEVFESFDNDSANTVIIDRDAVYVNGGDDSTGNSAYYDTLKVTESGSIVFAESNTDNYTYAGLHDYMTYATYFEKVEISNDALMILQADDANWFKDATNNTTGGSGRSILELSADASSGFMIDIDFFWSDPSTWYYNDGSSETSLNNLSTLTHGNGAYLRDATNIEIHLDAGAVEAINNTYVYKNPYANSAVNLDWSTLTWDNGINVKQANQDESNHHVVLSDYSGNADSITLDEVVTIQSLTGASNLTLDENLAITGDMYDYIGTVTINNGNKLDVGGTLDMSTSSEMIMSYSAATGAAVSADHIDFAGSVELHVDYSSVNPNNADPQTGIIEEWAVFDASSTSGSIDELIFKTSGGNEFVESDLGAVVLVGTADGGVQVVKYDSSKHILDDGSNDLTGTTNAEVYYGFAGDDSITISDYDTDGDGTKDGVNLQYLDGGEGHDTLALQGDADNFQSLFTDELFRLNRIETLDITGLDGTLTLDEAAVRGLSDTNVLQVDGDSNTILDLNGFVEDTTKSVSGYTVYKSADSEIHVDTDITVK